MLVLVVFVAFATLDEVLRLADVGKNYQHSLLHPSEFVEHPFLTIAMKPNYVGSI